MGRAARSFSSRQEPGIAGISPSGLSGGETPEGIVRSYRSLQLADVYAVISRYLANPAPFDEYLRQCDEEAEAVRRKLESAGMTNRVSKKELQLAPALKG